MQRIVTLLILVALMGEFLSAQINLRLTSPEADAALKGLHDPAVYHNGLTKADPQQVTADLQTGVSEDSLRVLLEEMVAFDNRNTGADTVSTTRGIGAARRWVYRYFQRLGQESGGRLIPSYFDFNRNICGQSFHRNIMAVLPGRDTTLKQVIFIEGHIDSRCEGVCDVNCLAEGAEDNASGTALVMELARCMKDYSFDQTLVFMVTIGEEQGLFGADAVADYCEQEGIQVKAVLNNDVIGGIICGESSSPPSCPGFNLIDSTRVRLFSDGGFNSPNKQLCRYIKLQYEEMLQPLTNVPMELALMSAEDRTGRGGDHIPFRQRGYPAMRFTSAHEHGDAGVSRPGYADRQHSVRDGLGVDTNSDGILDSLFVNLNYLARNARINGTAAAMLALGPEPPVDFAVQPAGQGRISVGIADPDRTLRYRIAVRTDALDWDTVFTLTGNFAGTFDVKPAAQYLISVARFDTTGVESLFSEERRFEVSTGLLRPNAPKELPPIRLMPNRPNPFDDATLLGVWADKVPDHQQAWIQVATAKGEPIAKLGLQLAPGANEVLYTHGYGMEGIYLYSLVMDGKMVETRKMVFAN